jgi:hypothetical protein
VLNFPNLIIACDIIHLVFNFGILYVLFIKCWDWNFFNPCIVKISRRQKETGKVIRPGCYTFSPMKKMKGQNLFFLFIVHMLSCMVLFAKLDLYNALHV